MSTHEPSAPVRAAEFFAGIGLVRQALAPLGVEVVWANDIERAKRDVYAANHDASDFLLADVCDVTGADLPPGIDLATSSFPCIDLSLAGHRRGLAGGQSGLFWQFARVLDELGDDRPRVVLLENVPGFATSDHGDDLSRALAELARLGYSCDVFVVDARHFVPQSRPRLFVVGVRGDVPPEACRGIPPESDVRPAWVQRVHARNAGLHHLELPPLPSGPDTLDAFVESLPASDARWWDGDRLDALTASMSAAQQDRLGRLRDQPIPCSRTAYRRTRQGVAVWEMRRDAIAGCLRTTGGGSSKQALVLLGGGELRARWMTPLEYARLMGAGEYRIHAGTANQALFGFGDAVVVDVVRWIGEHYLLPVLRPALVPA